MRPGPPELEGAGAPGDLAAPFRIEQRLVAARLRSLRNKRGVETGREEEQVVRDPIALRVLVLRRIGLGRIRLPLQHEAFFLERHDRRGAVEHVRLRPARPAFVDDLDRKLGRVGARRAHLDAVFLLERRAHGTHELGDDLGRVPDHLAFLPGRFDQGRIGGPGRPRRQDHAGRHHRAQHAARASHGVLPQPRLGRRFVVGTSRRHAAAGATQPQPSAVRSRGSCDRSGS
jgi:hypothetical protein